MVEPWQSVTVRAGLYRITIPRKVLEHEVGVIGGYRGAQIDNVFRFCHDKLLKLRPEAKHQKSYSIVFNETIKPGRRK